MFFSGTAAQKARIRKGKDSSGLVVDVSRVIARIPGDFMSVANDFHSIRWHEKFDTIDCLLDPTITLYFVDLTRAFFVQHPPEVNIYDTRKFPFFFIAQRKNAIRTFEVPISELIKLGEKIGDPKCRVAWVNHTGRCGSTLVAQGLNAIPDCTVISESQEWLVHLAAIGAETDKDFTKYVNGSEFSQIMASTVRYQLKDFARDQLVCVKTTASLSYLTLPLIAKRFPEHRFISVHRDGVGTAKSFWRMIGDHKGLCYMLAVLKHRPNIMIRVMKKLFFIFTNSLLDEVRHHYTRDTDIFFILYVNWLTNIVTFQRTARTMKENQILPLVYDDILADKHSIMMEVRIHFLNIVLLI